MGRHRKLPSRLIASSFPYDAPLFRHQYCGENIKMMEEGVDVEAFYVCVKFTLFVSPGQPCRGVHQDSLISVKFTHK
jgi:hypothetical protein